MAYSRVSYTGDASTSAFNIPFSVLAQSEVRATIDGVVTVDFTLNAASTVLTFTTPPANGTVIVIFRLTDIDDADRPVDFQKGSTVREQDLDLAITHILHAVQEAIDGSFAALSLATDGNDVWDALFKRIRNVGAPLSENDAVRLVDLQNVAIVAGNLPPVTVGNNNSSLFVEAGAWAIRTPAQARVHLGLGTAATLNVGVAANNVVQLDGSARYPAADGRNIDLSQNTSIPAQNSQPTAVIFFAVPGTPINNTTSATYRTDGSGVTNRAAVTATGALEFNDGGGYITPNTSPGTITLLAGKYLVEVHLSYANANPSNVPMIEASLDNAAGTVNYDSVGSADRVSPPLSVGATRPQGTIFLASILNLAVTTDICVHHKNHAATGTVDFKWQGSKIIIHRLGS